MSVKHMKIYLSSLKKVNLNNENFSSTRQAEIKKKNDKYNISKSVEKWTLAYDSGNLNCCSSFRRQFSSIY